MMTNKSTSKTARDLVGVIDIGSNSVRLVISDLNDLRPSQHLLNQKVMCQLGFGLNTNDSLDPERRAHAISTLTWFANMVDAATCRKTLIFATAAIRQADDGDSFVAEVERLFKVPVQILTGQEEAETSALGIRATIYGASGLVADLGGGSLEIAKLSTDGQVSDAFSLPFGTLILKDRVADLSPKDSCNSIRSLLKNNLEDKSGLENKTLYLIGGTWRALALEHLRQSAYPLKVIHRYSLTRKDMKAYCRHIVQMGDEQLADLFLVAPRRREVLREACAVILSLLKASGAKEVVFSSAGVREGFLHSQLNIQQAKNPEVQAAADLIIGGARFVLPSDDDAARLTISEQLFDWSKPLRDYFLHAQKADQSGNADARHMAACHLAEFGWSRHPSYKAEETALMILQSNRLPQSHVDRAYLALCLFKRYGGRKLRDISKQFKRLLPKRLRWEASVFGLVIRIAMELSTALPGKLAQTRLVTENDKDEQMRFVLRLPKAWASFPLPAMKAELQTLQSKYDTTFDLRFDL